MGLAAASTSNRRNTVHPTTSDGGMRLAPGRFGGVRRHAAQSALAPEPSASSGAPNTYPSGAEEEILA